jgi:hypothetical protein
VFESTTLYSFVGDAGLRKSTLISGLNPYLEFDILKHLSSVYITW